MLDNIPRADVEESKGSRERLVDLEVRLAKQENRINLLEIQRRRGEERIAILETFHAGHIAEIAARQDEQPFNCLDDCATQRSRWNELREENDRLIGALHLASTRADEAEKEVTFLSETNDRFRKNLDNLRENAEQILIRANCAEADRRSSFAHRSRAFPLLW